MNPLSYNTKPLQSTQPQQSLTKIEIPNQPTINPQQQSTLQPSIDNNNNNNNNRQWHQIYKSPEMSQLIQHVTFTIKTRTDEVMDIIPEVLYSSLKYQFNIAIYLNSKILPKMVKGLQQQQSDNNNISFLNLEAYLGGWIVIKIEPILFDISTNSYQELTNIEMLNIINGETQLSLQPIEAIEATEATRKDKPFLAQLREGGIQSSRDNQSRDNKMNLQFRDSICLHNKTKIQFMDVSAYHHKKKHFILRVNFYKSDEFGKNKPFLVMESSPFKIYARRSKKQKNLPKLAIDTNNSNITKKSASTTRRSNKKGSNYSTLKGFSTELNELIQLIKTLQQSNNNITNFSNNNERSIALQRALKRLVDEQDVTNYFMKIIPNNNNYYYGNVNLQNLQQQPLISTTTTNNIPSMSDLYSSIGQPNLLLETTPTPLGNNNNINSSIFGNVTNSPNNLNNNPLMDLSSPLLFSPLIPPTFLVNNNSPNKNNLFPNNLFGNSPSTPTNLNGIGFLNSNNNNITTNNRNNLFPTTTSTNMANNNNLGNTNNLLNNNNMVNNTNLGNNLLKNQMNSINNSTTSSIPNQTTTIIPQQQQQQTINNNNNATMNLPIKALSTTSTTIPTTNLVNNLTTNNNNSTINTTIPQQQQSNNNRQPLNYSQLFQPQHKIDFTKISENKPTTGMLPNTNLVNNNTSMVVGTEENSFSDYLDLLEDSNKAIIGNTNISGQSVNNNNSFNNRLNNNTPTINNVNNNIDNNNNHLLNGNSLDVDWSLFGGGNSNSLPTPLSALNTPLGNTNNNNQKGKNNNPPSSFDFLFSSM
ncbi:hypothetical protein ABK040_011803 [Willaertia magna]